MSDQYAPTKYQLMSDVRKVVGDVDASHDLVWLAYRYHGPVFAAGVTLKLAEAGWGRDHYLIGLSLATANFVSNEALAIARYILAHQDEVRRLNGHGDS